jgi:hypothetical protein
MKHARHYVVVTKGVKGPAGGSLLVSHPHRSHGSRWIRYCILIAAWREAQVPNTINSLMSVERGTAPKLLFKHRIQRAVFEISEENGAVF